MLSLYYADKYGDYNPRGCFRLPILKMAASSRFRNFPLHLLSHLLFPSYLVPYLVTYPFSYLPVFSSLEKRPMIYGALEGFDPWHGKGALIPLRGGLLACTETGIDSDLVKFEERAAHDKNIPPWSASTKVVLRR